MRLPIPRELNMSSEQLLAGLSSTHRKTALHSLLAYTFFMVIGFSMVIPLVAVHFVNNMGMTAAIVGIALAIRQTLQQGLSVVGGLLADRWGIKPMIVGGVLLRAIGFMSLGWANDPLLLLLAMSLSALGGAIFEAPYQAAIVALTNEEERPNYYSLSNWVGGSATAIGPLIGVFLLQFSFSTVCIVAALCFAVNSVIALLMLPSFKRPTIDKTEDNGFGIVLKNRRFVFFTAAMMGYWFTSVQFNLSFPLWSEKISGHQESVGIMYSLSAILTIAFQYHLIKWCQRWLTARDMLLLGLGVMSISCLAIGLSHNFYAFLGGVAVFTLGVLLTRPSQQTLTANLADSKALGRFMGFSYLGLAVGGGLGNWLGGLLIETALTSNTPTTSWLIYALVGLTTTILLARVLPNNTLTTQQQKATA